MKIESDRIYILLIISLAVNIFLVAFIIGRASIPTPVSNPNFMFDNHNRMPPPHNMQQGEMPPPPPPPFLFSSADLFNPQEMKEDFFSVQAGFDKIYILRKDFIEQLKKDKITKEEILKHFSEVDKVMSDVRNKTQEKAAEKIVNMTKPQRDEFIEKISNN